MAADTLRLGIAEVVINPPPGAPMAGYYHNRASAGVHDDLYAKALVMDVSGTRVALVACDLIHLSREVVEQARARITQSTAIPADHVMISATHAHTGPVILHHGSIYQLEGKMRQIAERYARELPDKIAESVRKAAARLETARVEAGTGHEDTLTFNRRFFMRDGSVGWTPGKRNPEIVKPAGPIDAEVPVVYFTSPPGEPKATYVNHALH
ncbi:MAG: hypothetical protein GY953_56570, partial [bacterium]|nr:hypothetical protein [bacterium]